MSKKYFRAITQAPCSSPSMSSSMNDDLVIVIAGSRERKPCYCDDHQGTNMYCPSHGTRS